MKCLACSSVRGFTRVAGTGWFQVKHVPLAFTIGKRLTSDATGRTPCSLITHHPGLPDNTVTLEDETYLQERFTEFVPGGELRIEAAYELTREIRVNAGLQYLYFGRGIGRGFDSFQRTGSTFNDEDLTMIGASLGFEINH